MKRFERYAWVGILTVGCNAAAWMSLGGCGPSDDTGDAGDSAVDQTADTSKDSPVADVVQDVIQNDVTDGGNGAADAATILNFQQQYAAALCNRMSKCCYGAQLDASAPDASINTCESFVKSSNNGGIEYAIGELAYTQVVNGGHIIFDQAAATSCLAGLSTLSCGSISGTEYTTVVSNCLQAMRGTLSTNAGGCFGSVECNGGYCQRPDGGFTPDAGGTCKALSTVGQACDPFGGGNDDCMYRGWLGTQQARCDTVETTANTCASTGNPTFKCTAKTANTGTCLYEWECASGTCGDTCTCIPASNTWTLPFSPQCDQYFPDAGLN